MGVRYYALIQDFEGDPLRPKNIDHDAEDHLECPKRVLSKDYYEIITDKSKEIAEKCCNNCCVFCVLNLSNLEEDSLDIIYKDKIKPRVNLFNIKNLFMLYIIKESTCDRSEKLKKKLKKDNYLGVIMTENQYVTLMGLHVGHRTILKTATKVENSYKPKDDFEHPDISVQKHYRNHMKNIIVNYIDLMKRR